MLILLDVHLHLPKNGLKKKKIIIFCRAPRWNPDLNPIGYTWGTLCRKVCATNKLVLSVNELEEAILTEWQNIYKCELLSLFHRSDPVNFKILEIYFNKCFNTECVYIITRTFIYFIIFRIKVVLKLLNALYLV